MLRVLIYVSLAGKAKNEKISYRKCRVCIGNHVTRPATNHLSYAGHNHRRGRSWIHKARDFSDQCVPLTN